MATLVADTDRVALSTHAFGERPGSSVIDLAVETFARNQLGDARSHSQRPALEVYGVWRSNRVSRNHIGEPENILRFPPASLNRRNLPRSSANHFAVRGIQCRSPQ